MAGVNDIEAAVVMAEAETGIRGGKSKIRVCIKPAKTRHRIWTKQEDEFLCANVGRLPEKEIAHRLGRTICSVHIRRERELHLVAPLKDPSVLTAEHVAMGLGTDAKTIHMLIDRSIMPGRRLPVGRTIRVVERLSFLKWLCNPEHWIYFKIDRVGNLHPRGGRGFTSVYDFVFWEETRQLVLSRYQKRKDEWLTPGQVAKLLKVPSNVRYVNKAVRKGNLKATRWGNWWIRKSSLPKGKTINFRGDWVNRHKED